MTQSDEMKGVKLVHIAVPLKLERPQWFFVVGRHISFLPVVGWKSLKLLATTIIAFLYRIFSLAAELASCFHGKALQRKLPANLPVMSIQKLCLYSYSFEKWS